MRLYLILPLLFFITKPAFSMTLSERERCVDVAIKDLGISLDEKSDPNLLKEILRDEMYLDTIPEITTLLKDKLEVPMSMKPMLLTMRRSIIDQHPAIAQFLCAAHDKGYLVKSDLNRIIHHTFIYDDIIQGIIKDHKLMTVIYENFLKKRESYGIPKDTLGAMIGILKAGAGLFGAAKDATMGKTAKMYGQVRERGYLTDEEIRSRINGLRLNILEAYATDRLKSGNKNNAYTGLVLAEIAPETLRVVGDERRIEYILDEEWTSLYETWNLAFITGNLEYLHILYPKLMIPSVLAAKPHDYVFNRAVALWLSLNFWLFTKLENKIDAPMENAKAIAELWGTINYGYAAAYIEKKRMTTMSAFILANKMSTNGLVANLVSGIVGLFSTTPNSDENQ